MKCLYISTNLNTYVGRIALLLLMHNSGNHVSTARHIQSICYISTYPLESLDTPYGSNDYLANYSLVDCTRKYHLPYREIQIPQCKARLLRHLEQNQKITTNTQCSIRSKKNQAMISID